MIGTRALAAAAMMTVWPVPAFAQTDGDVVAQLDALFGSADPFVEAFRAIQDAVDAGDAETLAAWAAYPLRTSVGGEEIEIPGPEAFVESYGDIVSDEVEQAVVNQRFADLFVNAEGVMFGDGQVWLSAICADSACTSSEVRIIAIQSAE